jgi:RND family efflux transporter MFP subunit
MKKGWLIGGLAAAGAALLAGAVAGGMVKLPAGDGKDKKPEPALEFVAREVVQPLRVAMPGLVEFSGPLVAPATAVVRAKAGGTLLALAAVEGQRVKAGQALGRIDLAEQGSRAVERAAGVEAARTALAQAERTHASNERLAAQQFISTIALDNSRAAVETARAQLAAAEAALQTTRVGLRDAVLAAPIGGIVAKRHVLPGEKVAPEQAVLTIVDLARLELAGRVGTHEVSRLAAGMPVEVRVEGVTQPVAGRIARIAPAAEPGTRAIGVAIEIANPQEIYRAGQYAVARVVLPDDTPRLTLPAAAVGQTGGQDHVWVIVDGLLARRAVTLGRSDERAGRVEVLQGVEPTDTVLAARFENLREGAKALVVAPRSAALASAAASSPPAQR